MVRTKSREMWDELGAELGQAPLRVSPHCHVAAGAPSTLVLHGAADTVIPVSTARLFVDAMRATGNRCDFAEYPGEGHGFFNFARERFYDALSQVDRFLVSLGYIEGESTVDVFRRRIDGP